MILIYVQHIYGMLFLASQMGQMAKIAPHQVFSLMNSNVCVQQVQIINDKSTILDNHVKNK